MTSFFIKTAAGLVSSWLIACGVSETVDNDVCVGVANQFYSLPSTSSAPKINLQDAISPDEYNRIVSGEYRTANDYLLRLGFIRIPLTGKDHSVLELVEKGSDYFANQNAPLSFQSHGVLRTKEGKPMSFSPCDLPSIINYTQGQYYLFGRMHNTDKNMQLFGRNPHTYIEIEEVDSNQADLIQTEVEDFINDFNQTTHRYQPLPTPFNEVWNSNVFTDNLLRHLKTKGLISDIKAELPSGISAPGFSAG